MQWVEVKKSGLIEDTVDHAYGLYALREFKKGDALGLYVGKYIETMLNENKNIWQLKNLTADNKTSYMGRNFINDPFYNIYSKNKELGEMATRELRHSIDREKKQKQS